MIWIASDGGLTRFDPAEPTEDQMWFTYTPANSPLILNDVRSLALDSHGNLWLTNVSVQSSNGALFRFNPNVTFAASDQDWVAMSNKTLNVQWAYLTGRLKIQGSHSLVKELDEIFP